MSKSLKILLVVLVGIAASAVAGFALPDMVNTPVGYGASFLIAAAIASTGVALFTVKPDPSRFVTPTSGSSPKTSSSSRFVRPAPKVTTTDGAPLAVDALPAPSSTPTEFKVDGGSGCSLLVSSALQEDGSVAISVKVTGYSGSQFKTRIRARLENVRGVCWNNPVNEKNGTRRMEGTVRSGDAATALRLISGIR